MAGVERRPFVGSWRADGQTIVQHTPDCVVTVNGYLEIPGCPSCNGRIDLQNYITSVTVDSTLEPPASATVAMFIPSVDNQFFFRDGDFLLQPGLEIRIYMRGYFPQKFLTKEDADRVGANSAGFNPADVPVYPYYHVFHGVVTSVSHEYSGGDYTATLTCADTLNFWNTLKVSTNGAVLGVRPDSSLVDYSLYGHTFMGASPYSIIYTLFRVGFGAAGGVEYNFQVESNIDGNSSALGLSLYKAAALYWENRWSSRTMNLKMYGADGTLYNGFEQAYLGAFEGRSPEVLEKLSSRPSNFDRNSFDSSSDPRVRDLMRQFGYNPLSSRIALTTSTDGKTATTIDVVKMQAFTYDVSLLGNVSVFETEYATKMEIAEAVKEVSGFEFFQDATGDLVFKPPFYNLDTSTDPVFIIEDRDLISISETANEPEATMVKVKGSQLKPNLKVGLEAWLLPSAVFIDYRLVAQFGWREAGPFECNYLTDTKSLYATAINRLDLLNAGAKSAQINIPLRPEIRLGYPVYVRFIDSYYYVTGLSHSFAYGGQCTTSITGVAKRSKFNAPGLPPGTREANVTDIRLDNLYLPAIPLSIATTKYEELLKASDDFDLAEIQRVVDAAGPRRHQGFPNVVMALNTDEAQVDSLLDLKSDTPDSIIQSALALGILVLSQNATGKTDDERRFTGPYLLQVGGNVTGQEITRAELIAQYNADTRTSDPSTALGRILQRVRTVQGATSKGIQNYLNLIKNNRATYAPGTGLRGQYRYYSCSHPDPVQQGITGFRYADGATQEEIIIAPGNLTSPATVQGFTSGGGFGTTQIQAGIPIFAQNPDGGATTVSVPTRDIYAISFMQNFSTRKVPVNTEVENSLSGITVRSGQVTRLIEQQIGTVAGEPDQTMKQRYEARYASVAEPLNVYLDLAFNYFISQSGQSKGVAVQDTLEAFWTVLVVGSKGNLDVDINKTLEENFPAPANTAYNDEVTVQTVYSTYYEGSITDVFTGQTDKAVRVINQKALDNPFNPEFLKNLREFRQALDVLVDTLNGEAALPEIAPPDTSAASTTRIFATPVNQTDFTPVYPVSDSAGYEVYGCFPYGRGLTVASFVELFLKEKAGDRSAANLLATGGSSTSSTTLQAIEILLEAYRVGGKDLNGTFQSLKPEVQATLMRVEDADAVYSKETASSFDVEALVSQLTQRGPQPLVLASNIPTELAEITVGEDQLCSCKTADAAIYLLARTLDPLTYGEVAREWQANKNAISGATVDRTKIDLAARFAPFQQDSNRFFANEAIAKSQAIFDALGDTATQGQRLRDLANPNDGEG